MNIFDIRREPFKGSAAVLPVNDEFNDYIKKWGIAKTILHCSSDDMDYKVLAKIDNRKVGVEFLGKVFFLPFHTTRLDDSEAQSLLTVLCRSILDYLQKRRVEIPDWVNEFCFESEKELRNQLDNLLKECTSLQNELLIWRKYKGILTHSGEILKDTVVSVLRDFFHLIVSDVEDFKEDALIKDDNDNVLAAVEIKGTKGGVKRDYINQIDSHRERNSLELSIPGVLIINDYMSSKGIQNKFKKTVATKQIEHAKRLNVLIIRTIDLIFLIKNLEKDSSRRDVLLARVSYL